MKIRPYEQLVAWKESHLLCLKVYAITSDFPKNEIYALVNQMRRSAYSVPMNIAEGNSKRSSKDKARFFEIALASLEELHYQSTLSKDLHYINPHQAEVLYDHISRSSFLLTRLRSKFVPSSIPSIASDSSDSSSS